MHVKMKKKRWLVVRYRIILEEAIREEMLTSVAYRQTECEEAIFRINRD